MKFKGKVSLWWLITLLFVNLLFIYIILVTKSMLAKAGFIVVLVIADVFMLSWTFNNYVELKNDYFTIHFGFAKTNVKYEDVVKISETNNPIGGSALSLDRLLLVTKNQTFIIAPKEKEAFIAGVMKHC